MKPVDLILAVMLAGTGYVYWGFFSPDPYLINGSETSRALFILWAYRIGIPVLALGFVTFWFSVRREAVRSSTLLLLIGSVFAFCLILYPFADWIFQRSYPSLPDEFHPYLQLAPRENDIPFDNRDGRYVILCLGGSTTEFTDTGGEGWPDRLEEALRDAVPGRSVEVYNEGRQWYTTLHTLINYETNLRHVKPDAIIIMQSINDLLNNADFSYFSSGEFRRDYGHFRGPVSRMIDREGLLTYIARVTDGLWYARARTIIDTDTFPGITSFESNLRTIIELAKADSTRIILMSEPFLFRDSNTPEELEAMYMLNKEAIGETKQWSSRTALSGMRQYNAVMKMLAEEHGLLFVDLDAAIPKSLEYFSDDVHYRDRTYDLVSETISRRIVESSFLR